MTPVLAQASHVPPACLVLLVHALPYSPPSLSLLLFVALCVLPSSNPSSFDCTPPAPCTVAEHLCFHSPPASPVLLWLSQSHALHHAHLQTPDLVAMVLCPAEAACLLCPAEAACLACRSSTFPAAQAALPFGVISIQWLWGSFNW